jgi:hypothetical protein
LPARDCPVHSEIEPDLDELQRLVGRIGGARQCAVDARRLKDQAM